MEEILKQYQNIEQEEKEQMASNSQYCSYLYAQYFDHFLKTGEKEDISWKTNVAVQQTILGDSYPLYFLHQLIHFNENKEEESRGLIQSGIKDLKIQFPTIQFQYRNQMYKIVNLFSTALSPELKEKLYCDIYEKPRNCHQLAIEIAKEVKGKVCTGYLQFPTMNMLHSWCVKDGLVYDTMYHFILTQELYETIFNPVDVIAISYDSICNEKMKIGDIEMPYPVYLYCDYRKKMKQK